MAFFQTKKIPIWINFMAICNILQSFGMLHGHMVGIFCSNLVHFTRFGTLNQEKSGNPAGGSCFFNQTLQILENSQRHIT
jgi:hypothetical protein